MNFGSSTGTPIFLEALKIVSHLTEIIKVTTEEYKENSVSFPISLGKDESNANLIWGVNM